MKYVYFVDFFIFLEILVFLSLNLICCNFNLSEILIDCDLFIYILNIK